MSLFARLAQLAGYAASGKKSRPARSGWHRRPMGELLEGRDMLSASVGRETFPGNDRPPTLNLSAIGTVNVRVGETLNINLPVAGATLTDSNAAGTPITTGLRWLADPDTGRDFPTGATLTAAGLFAWTPTVAQVGTQIPVTIIGIDGGTPAFADVDRFFVNVTAAVNLAEINNQNATVGRELVVPVTVTGASTGQVLRFTLGPNPPAGATITRNTDNQSATVRYTPTATGAAVAFEVLVFDDASGTPVLDSEAFTVDVRQVNVAPSLTAGAVPAAAVGTPWSFTVNAADTNTGQTLTVFLDPNSTLTGATVSQTGNQATINWTPTAAGTFRFTVLVSDNAGSTHDLPLVNSESFSVTVTVLPAPPTFSPSPIPAQSVQNGSQLTVNFSASDPNGDTFTYALDVLNEAGTVLDLGTNKPTLEQTGAAGVIRWTPTATGALRFRITATDTTSRSSTSLFNVTVTGRAPTIGTIAAQSVIEGRTLTFDFPVSDADGEVVTLSLPTIVPVPSTGPAVPAGNLPAVTRVDGATGRFTWTPTTTTPGVYDVTVRATDPTTLFAERTLRVTVTDDTTPPTVTAAPSGAFTMALSQLLMTFSEPVTAASLAVANFSLNNISGLTPVPVTLNRVEFRPSGNDAIAVVPTTALGEGTYELTLTSAGIRDLAGNTLGAPFRFVFTIDFTPASSN
ncbi:MAG: putative Ig domain-containing protein [Lacipirellulaceae bacterium]